MDDLAKVIFESLVEQERARVRAIKFIDKLDNYPGLGTSLNYDTQNVIKSWEVKSDTKKDITYG